MARNGLVWFGVPCSSWIFLPLSSISQELCTPGVSPVGVAVVSLSRDRGSGRQGALGAVRCSL